MRPWTRADERALRQEIRRRLEHPRDVADLNPSVGETRAWARDTLDAEPPFAHDIRWRDSLARFVARVRREQARGVK